MIAIILIGEKKTKGNRTSSWTWLCRAWPASFTEPQAHAVCRLSYRQNTKKLLRALPPSTTWLHQLFHEIAQTHGLRLLGCPCSFKLGRRSRIPLGHLRNPADKQIRWTSMNRPHASIANTASVSFRPCSLPSPAECSEDLHHLRAKSLALQAAPEVRDGVKQTFF